MATRIRRTHAFLSFQYNSRLKELRQFFDRFDFRYDEKHLKSVDSHTRRLLRSRVNRTYKEFAPFLKRPNKPVDLPKSKIKRAALIKHTGVGGFKGLKRVPVPTWSAFTTRVTISVTGDVQVTIGDYKEKTFFFPRRAKTSEDFVSMAEDMLKYLPPGMYVLRTRRNILLHRMFERDLLVDEIAQFIASYSDKEGFVDDLIGVKWLGRTEESAQRRRASERKVRRELRTKRKSVIDKARDLIRSARAKKRKHSRGKSRAKK